MRLLPSVPQERMCRDCLVEYPATPEYFSVAKGNRGGLGYFCKSCISIRATKARRKNIEERRQTEREYQKNNRDKFRAVQHNRRAQKRSFDGVLTEGDIKAQYNKQHGECYYCRKKVGDDYHIDHYTPLARGGSNSADNIVIACPRCNLSKSDKLPQEWIDSKCSL